MDSDEKPFKVVDRRFSSYSTTQPAEEKYALPKAPVLDDPYEVFRIACAGEPDKPPATTTEKYEPVVTPHVSAAPHKDSNADSRFLNRVFGSVLLVGGLGLGIALYIGNQSITSRNYQPPRSSAAQTQQETFRARAVPTGFREYREARANAYKEFTNAIGPVRRIPVPPELIGTTTNPNYAGGFDLNNDGVDEIMLTTDCRDVACDNDIFQREDSGYRKIFGPTKGIKIIPKNGYADIFSEEKVGIPGYYFWNVIVKYSWDGNAYRETDRFMNPRDLKDSGSTVNNMLRAEQNAPDLAGKLQSLERMFGIDTALHAILSSQMASNIPLPEGDEYDRFLLQLSQDRGINYTSYSPDQLRRALFSTMISPDMLKSREGLVTVAGLSIANSIAKELGRDPYSQYLNTLAKTNGYVANYISQTGNKPNPERLSKILAYGSADAIREEELHTHTSTDSSTQRSWSSPTGSGNSRTFNPGDVSGDPRYLNNQPTVNQRQQNRERAQQMDQATRQRLQQGAERARQMGNQILKVLPKPPEKKPPGK